jgi:hypothetical protein
MAWKAGNKTDLIIEVWEKLDCESVGSTEIEAIEVVVADVCGPEAVDSPMVTARVLADEGAHLRHAEILDLFVKRAGQKQKPGGVEDGLKFDDLISARLSIERLEKLRSVTARDDDRHGERAVRDAAIHYKAQALARAESEPTGTVAHEMQIEIAEWLRVWLQTPTIFGGWIELRLRSKDFLDKFGPI